jgi:dCMP deaminase
MLRAFEVVGCMATCGLDTERPGSASIGNPPPKEGPMTDTNSHATDARIAETDPGEFLPRVKQVRWDHYYMEIALAVSRRANCLGALVGAVLVVENRVVSTGFNGTPAGFPNCKDGGCVRCKDRHYGEIGHPEWASDPVLAAGTTKQLDLCICVHAEANAIVTAARLGHRTTGATLYATHKPCFTCLKEAVQAGVGRIVWLKDFKPTDSPSLLRQYEELAEFLRRGEARNFEQLFAQSKLLDAVTDVTALPNLDRLLETDETGPGGAEIPIPPNTSPRKPAGRTPRKGSPPAKESGRGKASGL